MNQKLRKFVFILASILAVLEFADFIYAHSYRSLAVSIGFALIAYGNYNASAEKKSGLPTFVILLGLVICITAQVLGFTK